MRNDGTGSGAKGLRLGRLGSKPGSVGIVVGRVWVAERSATAG